MTQLFNILLFLHISSGMIAFVAAPIAMSVAKGGNNHRQFGKIFFYCMNVLCPSAFAMSIMHANMFLFMIAGFSYYLVLSGYRWLNKKGITGIKNITKADYSLLILAALFNTSLLGFAIYSIYQNTSNPFGYISFVFGLIGLLFVRSNYKQFSSESTPKYAWVLNHIGGMVGGYVATVSAFSVVNFHFLPEIVRWLWASVIGVPLIFYWIRKYRIKYSQPKPNAQSSKLKSGIAIVIFISLSIITQMQAMKFEGYVYNADSVPLQYVSVGIKASSYGTVTNANGYFIFYADEINSGDSIKFSLIGYHPKSFCLKDYPDSNKKAIVHLESNPIQLTESVVTASNLKKKVIGNHRINANIKVNFAIPAIENKNLGSEIGRRFSISKKSILSKFNFYLCANNYDTATFRINVYPINKGKPSSPINKENIIQIVTSKQCGWITTDLSSYNLEVDNDIAITVEWVWGSEHGNLLALPLTFPSVLNTHYYKYGSQNNWQVYHSMSSCMNVEIFNKL